ncbi:Gamma carbonic anhydrase like 1, CAL1 isoform 1 [Hibiscus syriacus]|uniref:Gamma carbonic anhydrase like 1, CAL1 isoform 1 n=1 Tax=Hibiscus syriacus TaxID=106335 RepID=A0A6A2ZZ57_HIBSY|nr:Gamma carbonic anhydrase like 1, CAL1 isoform 1 [Hibiscus syriacus]
MGRGKVELKRIENSTSRQATSQKKMGSQESFELSILCDAEVALVIFSSSGKVYQFASHDMDRTTAKYRRELVCLIQVILKLEQWRYCLMISGSINKFVFKIHIYGFFLTATPMIINVLNSFRLCWCSQFWRSEIEELKRSINTLEARQKHLSGEDMLAFGMRELKQLERQLKVGVERVRSRKLKELDDGDTSSGIVGENSCSMLQKRIVEEDHLNETDLPL